LPGNGEFHQLTSPSSVSEMVEFARRQLALRGHQPPFCLLAMSLGGMVAADWAQRFAGEIAALVLVNTSMAPFSSRPQRLRPHNWPQLSLLAVRWWDSAYAERVIHQLTCQRQGEVVQDLAAWRAIRQSAPVAALSATRQLLAAARFRARITSPSCPTLVLSSQCDELVSPECSTHLAAAWATEHQQHPWAGHDLPHDDAPWLRAQVARFAQQFKAQI
jgi:pimeloyl-ACP methyl ester carboxylesterase